ncbi:heavy-metal-associated domain-containing protein [Eubacterium multiforme]|uniref:Copper chaperone CopZ n=1 Tax=Eubacterium multiforme TaxID=83339 RepID=A0ABT9UTW9_9FIRM|nr:heavy-metal-associated domain-containing protein [Eubacterium multiforme]MDQ0149773.1 copper chaperone CopZ [Eubacterium multiforme]
MKAVLKIAGMNNSKDVRNVQSAIAMSDGVIASEVVLDRKEIIVIYNDFYIDLEKIIDKIEEDGYTVI